MGIKVSLCCLVEALEKFLVLLVLTCLLFEISPILLVEFTLIAVLANVLGLVTLSQLAIILVSLLEPSFLLEVYDLRVINTDGAPESFRTNHLIDQIHSLGRQLDPLGGLPLGLVGVEEANCMWVTIVEGTCRHQVVVSVTTTLKLSLRSNWDDLFVFETCPCHRLFILFLL